MDNKKNKNIIDRLNDSFFESTTTDLMDADEALRLERMRAVFVLKMQRPMTTDKQIVTFLMKEYGISSCTAYRYILQVNTVVGNIRNAGKEWFRYKANQILDEAYAAALAGDHRLSKSLLGIANGLTKVNRLETDEKDEIVWDEVIPQNFEPSSDPSVVGLKPLSNLRERIKTLKTKYIDDIEDVTIIEDVSDAQ